MKSSSKMNKAIESLGRFDRVQPSEQSNEVITMNVATNQHYAFYTVEYAPQAGGQVKSEIHMVKGSFSERGEKLRGICQDLTQRGNQVTQLTEQK